MRKDTQNKPSKSKRKYQKNNLPKHLEHINTMAAGIDIGAKSHFVAIPEGIEEVCVREFGSFTSDLYEIANWLEANKIKTVVMESTSVYWIP